MQHVQQSRLQGVRLHELCLSHQTKSTSKNSTLARSSPFPEDEMLRCGRRRHIANYCKLLKRSVQENQGTACDGQKKSQIIINATCDFSTKGKVRTSSLVLINLNLSREDLLNY